MISVRFFGKIVNLFIFATFYEYVSEAEDQLGLPRNCTKVL